MTAMQELIQRLKSVDENHNNAGLKLAIQIGNELLEKEKEQILNAYSEGADDEYEYQVNMVGNRTDIDCEKYYNETFNQIQPQNKFAQFKIITKEEIAIKRFHEWELYNKDNFELTNECTFTDGFARGALWIQNQYNENK